MQLPLILLTNDDGVGASGLAHLIDTVKELGRVVVVAPQNPQSGKSSAITVDAPLRYRQEASRGAVEVYSTNGTTVDCVKLALNKILDREPDLILSGVNHGSNSSTSVIYSGTMGGAIEGALHRIDSIGFSLTNFSHSASFKQTSDSIRQIVSMVLKDGLSKGVCLNVNIPEGELKGIKVCRQADGVWQEIFDTRYDTFKHEYFWLNGSFCNREPEAKDTDEYALSHGFVSIVPITIDLTAYSEMERLDKSLKSLSEV